MTSLSMFHNIVHLELSLVNGITHLNDLSGDCLVTLRIHVATRLEDITNLSNFPNLKEVSFFSCESLIDVSAVKEVRSVSISWCPLVTDLSMISGRQTEFEYYSDGILKSIAHMDDIDSLKIHADLSECELISFSEDHVLRQLFLTHPSSSSSAFSVPLSPLSGLNAVAFSRIDLSLWNEHNPDSLRTIETALIYSCSINNLNCFRFVRILCLKDLSLETLDFSAFLSLEDLSIDKFHRFIGFTTSLPKSLEKLSVSSCRCFSILFGLTDVPCVKFRRLRFSNKFGRS
jgi:hypothetical protein